MTKEEFPVGMRVVIIDALDQREFNGKHGEIVEYQSVCMFDDDDEEADEELRAKFTADTPVIKLDDGTIIHGYECWWITEQHYEVEVSRFLKN